MSNTATATKTVAKVKNDAVTPLNELVLVDSKGRKLEKLVRVETKEGDRAYVLRLDARSRRAVIRFDKVEGQEDRNDTMRAAHQLTIVTNKGKVSRVRQAAKAAKKGA